MKENVSHILYRINEEAAKLFCTVLLSNQGKAGILWLNDVGLSADTINRFNIGYAGDDKKGLVSHLNDLGYTNEQIIDVGLAECSDGDIKDKFQNRIMIPIIDDHYRVIGFSGRVVGKGV